MREVWNPYSVGDKDGAAMPFEEFKSWEELIEHYVVPKNEIVRDKGPGDAIQAGEWYLTYASTYHPKSSASKDWYICYVGQGGKWIKYWKIPTDLSVTETLTGATSQSGSKDGWGSWRYHYKVDIDNLAKFDFINWKDENPLEVKQ